MLLLTQEIKIETSPVMLNIFMFPVVYLLNIINKLTL